MGPCILKANSLAYNYVEVSFALGGGGGVKPVSRGDCEKQRGKLLRLLSQLRPRIRPLYSLLCTWCFCPFNIPPNIPYLHIVQIYRELN
jgi:hypothetical protein